MSILDLNKLYNLIEKALEYIRDVHIYECSIFRNLTSKELNEINKKLCKQFGLEIKVVLQDDEVMYTALGCYNNINYEGNLCIFIGGGGSIELVFVNSKKVIEKRYYDFVVVDITKKLVV